MSLEPLKCAFAEMDAAEQVLQLTLGEELCNDLNSICTIKDDVLLRLENEGPR